MNLDLLARLQHRMSSWVTEEDVERIKDAQALAWIRRVKG